MMNNSINQTNSLNVSLKVCDPSMAEFDGDDMGFHTFPGTCEEDEEFTHELFLSCSKKSDIIKYYQGLHQLRDD